MHKIIHQAHRVIPILIPLSLLSCTQVETRTPNDVAQETLVPPKNAIPNEPIGPPTRSDWPKFLGPHSNAVSDETGLLLDWPPEGPPILWSRPVGESYGAPVVAKDRLIMFHRFGNEEVIESIDAVTGQEIYWKYAYPTTYVDQYNYNGGPRSSPTIHEDRVYTYGAQGVITALDFATGELIWQRKLNEEYQVPKGFFGVGTAPVIEEDLLILNLGASNRAGVIALNKDTGKTVWTASDHTASYSTPIVRTLRDQRIAIFHTGDGLLVLEAKTGKILYQHPFRSRIRESAIAATPVFIDDTVFLSATYKIGAAAFKLAPEGLEILWQDPKAMQNHWATSHYKDGYLYGMDGRHESGSNFRCIDLKTGEVIWSHRAKIGRATFIVAEDHIIALGERGHLTLIEITPEAYKEKARVQLLNHPVWTPPILAQGRLYIRNETTLLCLDLRI